MRTFDPLRVAFGEHLALLRDARAAHGWCTRAQVLLRGPGWRPAEEAAELSAPTRG